MEQDYRALDFDLDEEDTLTRRRMERAQRMERGGDGNGPPKERSFTFIIGVQMALCVLLSGALIALYFALPETFSAIKEAYLAQQSQPITAQQASAWWDRVKEVMSHGVGEDLMEESLKDAGAGGADVPLADNLKLPGKNMSFSPVYVTMPACLPVKGAVSSPFGARVHPVTGENGYHTGIDIAAGEGERIAAAYDGTVCEISEDSTSGKYIILDHGNGLKTFYCHCSQILAEKGANVRAGETIALVGSTGQVTGPHLHFELRLNGVRYDPAFVLAGMLDGI